MAVMTAAYPAHREVDVALRDGSTGHVRPIRPEDEGPLGEFLADLSEGSRLFRFFSMWANLREFARKAVDDVDFHDRPPARHRLRRRRPRPFACRHRRRAHEPPVITVTEDTELRDVARILTMNRIKPVPVTRDSLLVGIASRSDLLRAWLRPDAEIRAEIVERILPSTLRPYLPDLDVDVRRGVVTLAGRVRDLSTVGLINEAVARMPCVVGVVDQLAFDEDDLAVAHMLSP